MTKPRVTQAFPPPPPASPSVIRECLAVERSRRVARDRARTWTSYLMWLDTCLDLAGPIG